MSFVARSGFVGALFLVGVALGTPGCGQGIEKRACMKVGTSDPLVTGAQLIKLDVYGATAKCSGNAVAAGSGTPIMSHTYKRGTAISIDVPPGPHTLVLITYADANGTQPLGQGCTTATLTAGAQICFDLSLTVPPDMAQPPGDLTGIVADMTPVLTSCDDTTPCANGLSCCSGQCVDTSSSVANCGGCGMSCSASHIVAACSNGSCSGACVSGYGDCNGDKRSDGCETSLDTTMSCSACGVTCDAKNSVGASCTGTTCQYTSCKTGFIDCDKSAPDATGCSCETAATAAQGTAGCCGNGCQTKHDNGVGDNFYDCSALGTHDQASALAACVAKTGDPNKCTGFICSGQTPSVYCDSTCAHNCSACNCWSYAGSAAGRVNTSCLCPGSSDPTWN